MTNVSLLKIIFRVWLHINTRRRIQLSILVVIMAISSLTEVFSIAAVIPFLGILATPDVVFNHSLSAPFIEYFGYTNPSQLFLPLTVLFITASILAGIMRIFLVWASTKLSFTTGHDISYKVYERTLYQPYSTHISKNSSEVINAVINKTTITIVHFIQPIIQILSSLTLFIAIISTLLIINSSIAMSAITGIGLIYLIIGTIAKKRLVNNGVLTARESSNVIKALQEGLGGIRDVLINGLQKTYLDIYRSSDYPLRMTQANNGFIQQSPRFLMEALGMSLIAFLAYFFSKSTDNFVEIIPTMGALALGAQRMLPILQVIYGAWSALNSEKKSVLDVLELLDQEISSTHTHEKAPIEFKDKISLDNISFSYNKVDKPVLENVNIDIYKGDRVGICGTTGSGKTTLLDTVMGLLKPTSGKIIIDSKFNIADDPYRWQQIIAHVPQDIFMSDTSIAENIAFGVNVNDIDMNRVVKAAKNAQIEEFISKLPNGYKTKMGEKGIQVSGGQRQRVGIARAFYKDASVLFFDEATSALDSKTEKSLMLSLNSINRNITVFMIAHRLTTLKDCNKVIQLENGLIKKIGSYDEIVLDAT
jgi:ATP-binding cassette, subfamily B, bacterial PglK